MKVRDLIRQLQELNAEFAEVKICSFDNFTNISEHFIEPKSNGKSIFGCKTNDLIFVWSSADPNNNEMSVFLINKDTAENTATYKSINEKMTQIKNQCQKLNFNLVIANIGKTATHKDRNKPNAIDAVTDHWFKANHKYIDVCYEGGCFFFDIVHMIDSSGIGTRDRAQFISIENLANFVDVLEKLQNGK